MNPLTSSHIKLVSYIIYRLSKEEEIPISEINDKFKKTFRNNVLDVVNNLFVQNGTVEIQGDKLVRGKAYSLGKDRYVPQAKYVIKESETGNKTWSYTYLFTPFTKLERLFATIRDFYKPLPPTIVKCRKISIIDPLNLGNVNYECEAHQKDNMMIFDVTFNPPLQAGQFAKIKFFSWIKHYYGVTVKEIIERYGIDYSFENILISSPLYYLQFRLELPWKPSLIQVDNSTKTPFQYNMKSIGNVYIFDIFNPPPATYSFMWRPPS
ncbi:hypothetical protein SJAV_26490 [Sulfurisphaera javensis]|uniref:Uncharacterized protein n=1 Tax=Sulfurisphaera javensis TaxID=2049879 RepID=A0AAT9GUY7_9CREN